MTSRSEKEAEMAEAVISDMEALRHERRNTELEDGLSIFDWADRVAKATKHAARLARQANPDLEYEAWLDVAEIVTGRLEQIRRLSTRAACEHDWPTLPPGKQTEPNTECLIGCGTLFGELEG